MRRTRARLGPSLRTLVAFSFAFVCGSARADLAIVEAHNAFVAHVADLVAQGDYATLDDEAERHRTTKARFEDGRWRLSTFHEAFTAAVARRFTDEPASQRAFAPMRSIATARPTSGSAWLLLAAAHDARAWQERGPGLAGTVSSRARPR